MSITPPADPAVIVPVGKVAIRLGMKEADLTTDQQDSITEAILEAQDAVEGHLHRPLIPYRATLSGLYPQIGFEHTDWRAWPQALRVYDDQLAVVSVTAEEGRSTYTVEFSVGLDAAQERPIVNYVRAHAVETLRNDPIFAMGKRRVRSLSAEGQSLTFVEGSVADGAAGALPNLKSLNQYRRHSAYAANRPPRAPWPMVTAPVGWDPRW